MFLSERVLCVDTSTKKYKLTFNEKKGGSQGKEE